MSNFVQRMKQANSGASKRVLNQDDKKVLTKTLRESFRLAQDDQMAGFQYQGVPYLMVSQDRLQRFINQGGQKPQTELEKAHDQNLKLIHLLMGLIDPAKEAQLFHDVDKYSFPFSEMVREFGTKSKVIKERMRKLNAEWSGIYEGNQILKDKVNAHIARQQAQAKPENNGKLT